MVPVTRQDNMRFERIIADEMFLLGKPLIISSTESVSIASESDFPEPIGGQIFLDNKRYIIANSVSISNELVPPTDGSVMFQGDNGSFSVLTYTGTGSMFSNLALGVGTIVLDTMVFSCPSGKFFNLDGSAAGLMLAKFSIFANIANMGNIDGIGSSTIACSMFTVGTGIVYNNTAGITYSRNFFRLPQDVGGSDMITVTGTNGDVQITSNFMDTAAANQNLLNITAGSTVTSGVVVGNGFNVSGGGSIFKAGSKDEKDLSWNYSSNSGVKDSAKIGSFVVVGNTTATTISTINVWTDINLGAGAVAGSDIERFSITDATTGEITYTGLDEFGGPVSSTMQIDSTGAAQTYEFRFLINGSVTTDGAVMGVSIASNDVALSFISPLKLVTGDTVRIQTRNIDGTRDLTIKNMVLNAG